MKTKVQLQHSYYLLPTYDSKSIGHYLVLSWVMKNNRNQFVMKGK